MLLEFGVRGLGGFRNFGLGLGGFKLNGLGLRGYWVWV